MTRAGSRARASGVDEPTEFGKWWAEQGQVSKAFEFSAWNGWLARSKLTAPASAKDKEKS